MDLQEFARRRREVEERREDAARAAGALQQLLKQAADEFGCDTLAKLRASAAKYEKEAAKLEAEYLKARKAWEERYGDRVGK